MAEVTIQVLAKPRMNAYAQCNGADCLIQGSLEDDLGAPLSNQDLSGTVADFEVESAGARPILRPCDESGNLAALERNQFAVARTNESGKFCFRIDKSDTAPDAKISVKFPGGSGYESAESRVSLHAVGSPASLNVLNATNRIAVEADSVALAIQLNAIGRETAARPISLAIRDQALRETKDKETVLLTAKTDQEGIAHFTLPGMKFGAPGPGHLVARYAGSRDIPEVSINWPVMKVCRVRLRTRIESGTTEVGDFADIVSGATSGCGPVSEGSIEYFVERNAQVTLPLKQGQANWQLSTFQLAPGDISIGTRYVAASGAWFGDGISHVKLHLQPVSGKRRALWLVSGCLVLIWFALRWQTGRFKPNPQPRQPKSPPKPQSLEVEPNSTPEFGWVGIVIDSHTGAPIADATVSIMSPGFAGTRTEEDARTTIEGSFVLPHKDLSPRTLLVVAAPRYLQAQWSMPGPGKLVVRLETRRRAIIRTFVHWADKTKMGISPNAEPTPAQVAQYARRRSSPQMDQWAQKVEVAAFGPDEPSAPDESLLSAPVDAAFGPKHSQ